MSYITVKFGEGQQQVFNPNCRAVCLLQNVRDRCVVWMDDEDLDLLHGADIDLADESGNVKYLRDSPYRYASEILHDRETLVLLRVEKHEGAYASYTPLLKDEEIITEEFLARLCVREDANSRPASSRRAKSNMRRSPADREGRKSKAERGRNSLKLPDARNASRSKSRQGK
ncbi:uncharacterized protein CXorf65 homolog [Babylonia areolata]|uniref:uncharacterized protein CXorf65 homolog n=1 Tax=Babylonia areolata TaxID=304850 RepID=UPI003FD5AF35